MINLCGKKKEIENSMWSVFTSFGYKEAEILEGDTDEIGKYCWFDKETAGCIDCGAITLKNKAEAVAIVVETAIANGLDNFEVTVSDVLLYDLLVLFGFEKMIKMGDASAFSAKSGDIEFAYGVFSDKKVVCKFDTKKFMTALENAGIDMSEDDISKSIIFAEKNAEGLAYDVAYNLRVNGCIVEYFCGDGDINEAEKYAKKNGFSCVLRAYADGILQIKDYLKNEIIETTVAEFLGYYEEDDCCDDDCDCGHHHEDEKCSCGHHHDGEHDCGCGHHHDHECNCNH